MAGMSATLVYFGMGSGLAIGVALLIVAILFLRTARRYVELAEERLELLREGQAPMPKVARQRGHVSQEGRRPEPRRSEKVPEFVGSTVGRKRGDETAGDPPPPEASDQIGRAHV